MDLHALLLWGKREQLRAAQRASVDEAGTSEADAEAAYAAPRALWHARASYARHGPTWEAAGVAGAAGAAPEAAEACEVDLCIHVSLSGELHTSIVPVSALPIASRAARGGAERIELRMVSQQQLFAHQLYPSAAVIARLIESNGCGLDVRVSSVLELGAGPALPCIVAALCGAAAVVATDFPDEAMLRNTQANLEANLPTRALGRCRTVGHAWGGDCVPLLCALRELTASGPRSGEDGFDLIVLSDLLYELEHEALLRTCATCLSSSAHAQVLVAFQPHDPIQLHKQLHFFALARQPPYSLCARRLFCIRAPPMFDATARVGSTARRVHVYSLWRAPLSGGDRGTVVGPCLSLSTSSAT
jgi:nicotinamide N-methyltransferase